MVICKSYGCRSSYDTHDRAEIYELGGYDELDLWRMLFECSYVDVMEDVRAAVLTYDRSMLWSQSLSGLSGHALGSLKLLIHASQGRIR